MRVLTRAAPGGEYERRWDPARPERGLFENATAVVHLAGATIAKRWTASRRREIRASRVDATRALVESLSLLGRAPRVLVSASAVGVYGDRGDQVLTEASAPGDGFLAELACDWEAEAERAGALGTRVVCLRFGIVLGSGGGVLAKLVPLFRLGLGGAPGSGRQWWSWLSIEDALRMVRRSLDDETVSGALNAVAPQPVTARDFARTLGRVLSRPWFAPAPAPLLRLMFGRMADEVLLASQRVQPTRLMELGFEFRHPGLEAALRAACVS